MTVSQDRQRQIFGMVVIILYRSHMLHYMVRIVHLMRQLQHKPWSLKSYILTGSKHMTTNHGSD